MSFKDVWWTAVVATLDTKVDEADAREVLLDSLRRMVQEMKPEDLKVRRVDHRSRLEVIQPTTRRPQ